MEEDEKGAGKPRERLLVRIEHHWIEIVAAALLALATMMSAYCAYESSRWSGDASVHDNRSNIALTKSSEFLDKANQEIIIDSVMISDYIYAVDAGNMDLARLYETQAFSPELKPAFNAWLAAKEAGKKDVPWSPFKMPEYKNKHRQQGYLYMARAKEQARIAKKANGYSQKYILFTVIFASVLFFAGISTKFMAKSLKIVMLAFGLTMFVGSVVALILQP